VARAKDYLRIENIEKKDSIKKTGKRKSFFVVKVTTTSTTATTTTIVR